MNPRALALWSLSAVTIALATGNPVYRVLVLLCALNLLVVMRRPGTSLRGLVIALIVAAIIAIAVTTLASHTGHHVLASLPSGIPVIGGPLTFEAAAFGVATGLGIAASVLGAASLSVVLQPHELIDALPAALARTGAAVGTALNLIPGDRAQRRGDPRRPANARLAVAADTRMAGPGGSGRAHRPGELAHHG